MNDALIGTIASVFDLLAAVSFFLVSESWQLFLGNYYHNDVMNVIK